MCITSVGCIKLKRRFHLSVRTAMASLYKPDGNSFEMNHFSFIFTKNNVNNTDLVIVIFCWKLSSRCKAKKAAFSSFMALEKIANNLWLLVWFLFSLSHLLHLDYSTDPSCRKKRCVPHQRIENCNGKECWPLGHGFAFSQIERKVSNM